MNPELLRELARISPEEQEILSGRGGIDRNIYMRDDSAEIDHALLLEKGKLITLRPHTRFVRFPQHTHNFVEMVYMCRGRTTHIINGTEVVLNAGELLILGQNAIQEILPAGEQDVAVNFIIFPQFFDTTIRMISEENPIRDFLLDCLRGQGGSAYLHFATADILPIQNLVENLIWTLLHHQPNKRSINQLTMGLLFLQLVNHTETMRTDPRCAEQQLLLQVYRYVEEHYRDGHLSDLAVELHYDAAWLSRAIKKQSGKNFTDLMQDKRLAQAAYLLKTTRLKVLEISESVGYENLSYFHRAFRSRYGVTPRQYRVGG